MLEYMIYKAELNEIQSTISELLHNQDLQGVRKCVQMRSKSDTSKQ